MCRYIERFRHGPPTDRTQRAAPGGTFWWRGQEDAEGGGGTWERGGANQEGVVGDIPPTGASTPGDKVGATIMLSHCNGRNFKLVQNFSKITISSASEILIACMHVN